MAEIPRISAAAARQKVSSGEALFVCAYESEEMCERNRLPGSISSSVLASIAPSLPRDREIIFYCA